MANIKVVFSPENATDKTFKVESKTPKILSVDEAGNCTALKAGEGVLVITTNDGNFVTECKVTVIAPVVPVESITLDTPVQKVAAGDSFTVGQ